MSDTQQSSIRESLSAAFDQQAEIAPAAEAGVAPSQPAAQDVPTTAPARQRDETGRFAAKAKEVSPNPEKAAAPAATPVPPDASAKPAEAEPASLVVPEKAPQSWTPAAREEWAKVPAPIRQEVLRREKEIGRVLSESAGVRKAWQEFEAVAAPYRALFTAPPVQVAANLFQTAAALQTGDIPTKAGILAQMIRNFGVSPDAVADALEGKQTAQSPHGPQYRDPRVDDLLRRQQVADQQRQQSEVAQAHQQLEAFRANAEFIQDVWPDMVALLETGRASTYEDAYSKACRMNDDVAKVVKQRHEAKARETVQAATTRARAAASSVRNEPAAPSSGAQPTSIRGALEAAFASHSGR